MSLVIARWKGAFWSDIGLSFKPFLYKFEEGGISENSNRIGPIVRAFSAKFI